jgi:hypothetical protein
MINEAIMELLIAILVWLGCFEANGVYTASEMEMYIASNHAAVQAIINDPAMQAVVWETCGSTVATIVVRLDEH